MRTLKGNAYQSQAHSEDHTLDALIAERSPSGHVGSPIGPHVGPVGHVAGHVRQQSAGSLPRYRVSRVPLPTSPTDSSLRRLQLTALPINCNVTVLPNMANWKTTGAGGAIGTRGAGAGGAIGTGGSGGGWGTSGGVGAGGGVRKTQQLVWSRQGVASVDDASRPISGSTPYIDE